MAAPHKLLSRPTPVAPVWADHGSGSAHDVTIFKPTTLPAGYTALSDYAQSGYSDAGTFTNWQQPYGPLLAVRDLGTTLLRPPTSWTRVYKATATKPMSLWRAQGPDGFLALGDVATTDDKPPPLDGTYSTVHTSCVTTCKADVLLWADKDGKLALYGARGNASSPSVGGLLADATSYPVGDGAASFTAKCLKVACRSSGDNEPEQLHIALGFAPTEMAVQWAAAVGSATEKLCNRNATFSVRFGLASAAALPYSAAGECTPFAVGSSQLTQENWNATLSGLAPSTSYRYIVEGGEGAVSATYNFTTAPDARTLSSSLPHQFIVYGDLGHTLPDSSSTVMPFVSRDVQHGPPGLPRGAIDMILHVGDFAYDFDSNGGTTGRHFMNDIQNYSASTPYMVSHGNHEAGFNFAHSTEFFRTQPSATGTVSTGASKTSPNNWWYSWNYGLVHFVTISTEIFFDHPDMVPAMLKWLEADLKAAQANRTLAPWIVAHGHRPLYCSCDGDCDSAATRVRNALEPLFYKFGVDLYVCGHEHDYERMFDVAPKANLLHPWLSGQTTQATTDMPATTYIVVGSAGNRENHEPFLRPKPDRTALALNEYGYGRLLVHNTTHMQWQFVVTDGSQSPPKYDIVGDEVMLVQHRHGPFASAR